LGGQSAPALLAFSYWLHIVATLVWGGGLATMLIFVHPAAREILTGNVYRPFFFRLNSRIQQTGWICLIALMATGFFQMILNTNHRGFLEIRSSWTTAIFFKHVAVGLLVLVNAYLTWILDPRLRRIYLAQGDIENESDYIALKALETIKFRLSWLNFLLFLAIFGFAAWAKVS